MSTGTLKIPQWHWLFSVRTKLAVVISVLIALISGFIFWYFPARFERQAIAAIADKAGSIAAMMAYNISPALVFDDHPTVCNAVVNAKQNSDLAYVMVLDESRSVLATFDSTRANKLNYTVADYGDRVSQDGLTYQTVAPILASGRTIGHVYLGISLESVNEEISRSRKNIAWVSFLIGVSGILLVVTLSAMVTRPLVRMVETADKIAKGDWRQRTKVSAKDEIGLLAKAFDTMVDNLEGAYSDLRRSEKGYRDLFESNPQPMWVFDLDSLKFIDVNDAVVQSYGYSRDEFLSMTIHDVITESPADMMQTLLTRHGSFYRSTKWKHMKRDGSIIDVEMSSHPLPLSSGRKARLVLASDITQRLRSEALLRESEERYRDLFESSSDLIQSVDAEGKFQFVNREWMKTLGYDESEIQQLNIFNIIKKEELPHCLAALGDVMKGQRLDRIQTTFIGKSGHEVIVEGNVSARFENGRPLSTRGVFRDITEQKKSEQALKESEERFRVLSAATFEGISVTENGIVLDTNIQYAKMLGYERQQLIGMPIFNLIHPDDHEIVRRQKAHGTLDPYEHRLLRKDGSVIYVEVRAQPYTYQGRDVRMSAMRDITARRLAEQALLFEKTRFEQLFENAPIGIVLADTSERIIHANRVFQTMFGYPAEEILGRQINDTILPYDLVDEGMGYTNRVLAGQPVHGEAIRRRKDGSLFDVELYGVPIVVRGESVGLFGIYMDVSERKKTEREIQLLAHTVASTKDCVTITDLQDRILFVNDAFLKIYGYAREEVMGRDVAMLRSPSTPAEIGRKILPATVAGGWYGEIFNRRKDGSEFPIELWTSVVNNDAGEPVAMVGVARDITERKRVEETLRSERVLLRTLIDNLPDAIFVKDRLCRKTVANAADVRNMGLQSEGEILGKDDFAVFPKEMAEAFFTDDQRVLQTGTPMLNKEEHVIDPNGNKRWLLTSKLPLRDERGQIVGLVGVGRDITEMKQVEEHRTQLMNELESANKELSDFAYIVSHDLKAPLRAIGSLADWLATDYGERLGNDGKEMLTVLLGRTKRMHDLIEGVLNYSRVGRACENELDIDLANVVPEVIEMIDPPKDIAVKIEAPLPVVRGEPTRIMQVFQNLLSNAIKFMDKPNGEVRIGCMRENGHWKFHVTDNGPGIDKKHFGKIFQIFQTLTARDEFESTGIGLTIVKKIVELHGGKIWVESEVGEGTSFFFTLPSI